MLITYCEDCGVLVRTPKLEVGKVCCADCASGRKKPVRASADSSRLPFHELASGKIMVNLNFPKRKAV